MSLELDTPTAQVFRPAPPSPAQLVEHYELGRRYVAELHPTTDVEELWAVYLEHTRYPKSPAIAAFFSGIRDSLDALRTVTS